MRLRLLTNVVNLCLLLVAALQPGKIVRRRSVSL